MSRAIRATVGTVWPASCGTCFPKTCRRSSPWWCPRPASRPARFAGDDYGVTDAPDWRGIDWPAHMHRIEIAGAEVNYVDIGEAGGHRPIVFVHGLAGQWQNWLENVPRFAQIAARRGRRPAGLRPLVDAGREDLHRALRPGDGRAVRAPRPRPRRRGGQLDGRLRVGRAGHSESAVRGAADAASPPRASPRWRSPSAPSWPWPRPRPLMANANAAQQRWAARRPALRHAVLVRGRPPSQPPRART